MLHYRLRQERERKRRTDSVDQRIEHSDRLPGGIAVDSDDNIYVTQLKTNSVNVYAKNANANAAPIRVINGSKTKLNEPSDLTIH